MTHDDRRLTRHLAIAVVMKLAALVLLWWLTAPAMAASADSRQTAAPLGVSASPTGVSL